MLRRQTLLERLSRIQRSIVHRAALQDVLDGIVAGAAELLGDEVSALRLVEPHNPTQMVGMHSLVNRHIHRGILHLCVNKTI